MANIKAFSCIRPTEEMAVRIAALPYDVYNTEEARVEVNREPLSFLRIDRAETQFPPSVNCYDEKVYEKAGSLLKNMIADGELQQDLEKSYYIYELIQNEHAQTGIAACASIDDFCDGIIRKHENTLHMKEEDRVRHITTCGAQTGPILLAYRSQPYLCEVMEQEKQKTPLYDFIAADGVRHIVYKVAQEENSRISEAFRQINEIYIADGHHRAAAAVRIGLERREKQGFSSNESEDILTVLFPDNQLKVLPYNRVVWELNGMELTEFKRLIEADFIVKEMGNIPVIPEKKGVFGMYIGKCWYRLTLKDDISKQLDREGDVVKNLDVSILHNYLLQPLLGIHDPRADKRIQFVGGIHGAEELENQIEKGAKAAFSLYPTSLSELFSVSDQRRLMPPKSTWFEPKLRSGIFIHSIQ